MELKNTFNMNKHLKSKAKHKKKPAIKINRFHALLIIAGYILIILLGIHWSPDFLKKESLAFFKKMADFSFWVTSLIKNSDLHYIYSIIIYTSIPLGVVLWVYILYYRLRTASTLDIPVISKYLPIPTIINPLYDESYKKTKAKVKELSQKQRQANKELTTLENELIVISNERNNLKKRLNEVETVRNNYLNELNNLIEKSVQLHSETDYHTFVFKEGIKLLDHVLKFRDFITQHLDQDFHLIVQEFKKVVNESANTITKITFDRINDKDSSIWILSYNGEYLELIASNGLEPEPHKKYSRGQGLAGWIWNHKLPAVCPNAHFDSRIWRRVNSVLPFCSIIGVPILDFDEKVLGALFVQCNRENVFDEIKDIFTLSYFGKILAIIFIDFLSARSRIADDQNIQGDLL